MLSVSHANGTGEDADFAGCQGSGKCSIGTLELAGKGGFLREGSYRNASRSRLTPGARATRIFAKMSFRRGGSHAPIDFFLSGLQQGVLENPDTFGA